METGRERPDAGLLLALAGPLELPAREREQLLAAAGLPPPAPGDPAPVEAAVARLLEGHEPFPALAVDRAWTLVAANGAVGLLTRDVDPVLLEPPVNVVRVALHPAGMARHVLELAHWRAFAVQRLRRAAAHTADERLAALADEVAGYPPPDAPGEAAGAFPRLRSAYGTLTFLPALTAFPTAAELTVVALHPVDARTRSAARAAALRPSGR